MAINVPRLCHAVAGKDVRMGAQRDVPRAVAMAITTQAINSHNYIGHNYLSVAMAITYIDHNYLSVAMAITTQAITICPLRWP